MKRLTLAALAAGLLIAVTPVNAKPPTPRHTRTYTRLYHHVAAKFGARTPGRNIARWGLASGATPSDSRLLRSISVLRRMLAPPVLHRTVYTAPSAIVTTTASYSATGAAGVPACASESGTNYSTGPDNTNASSGATGRYQILPSTAAAYGCDLSTPAGQDACAAVIYAHQGAGAWVGCGG